MWASMAARWSSFMRSRISPRINQTLSPSKAANPWAGSRAPLLGGEVLGHQRQNPAAPLRPGARAGALRKALPAAPKPPRTAPRRRHRATPRAHCLAAINEVSASSCCSASFSTSALLVAAALAEQREDDLFLAVVVGLEERQHVFVVVGHQNQPLGIAVGDPADELRGRAERVAKDTVHRKLSRSVETWRRGLGDGSGEFGSWEGSFSATAVHMTTYSQCGAGSV